MIVDATAHVVIVGGGPVGLAAALELSQHGVSSIVIEARPQVSALRPRAKTTSARTMEHFRRWGIAELLRERAPLKPSWSDEVVFCTTVLGREITRFDRCFGLHLIHDDLVAEGGQQVAQPLVEQVMRDTASSLPTVELRTGWTASSLVQDDDGVTVTLEDAVGSACVVRAAYAIGCDGYRSLVREAIGARYEGRDDSRPNLNIVFRAEGLADRIPHGKAVHHWVLNPSQPGVVGPLDLIDRWWCGAVGVDVLLGAVDPETIVRNLLGDDRAEIPIEIIATDRWRARLQIADTFALGRVFLAGDAAHQNPPWGGHGFNTGIGDAVNIGWKLAAVLNGWAPPSLLDTYALERRPVAAETIAEAATNMATLSTELSDARLLGSDEAFAAVRPSVADIVQRTKHGEFHSMNLVLGTSYRDSPIVCAEADDHAHVPIDGDDHQPSAAPGNRLPHHWLTPARSLFDELGRGYSLVGAPTAAGWKTMFEAAGQLGIPLTPVPLSQDVCAGLFEQPLVLVRPDQHVAWRGTAPVDPRALLQQVTGRTP